MPGVLRRDRGRTPYLQQQAFLFSINKNHGYAHLTPGRTAAMPQAATGSRPKMRNSTAYGQ